MAANHLSVDDLLERTADLAPGGPEEPGSEEPGGSGEPGGSDDEPGAPPATRPVGLRFPVAGVGQVRREVAASARSGPHARWWFLLAVVLLGLGSYATVLVPLLMGQIVDLVLGEGDPAPLWLIGGELVLVAVAGAALSAAGFYLVARLSERLIANLRQDMVGTALGLPTHQVEDAGTGDLVSRSTDDVAELSAAVTETLPTLSTSLFSIVATVIALSTLDWHFLVIPVVVAPVYYLAARLYLARAPQRYAAERAAMAERARRVLEAIRGRATVRAFSMEDRMHTEIENSSWSVVRKAITARTTMLVLNTWTLVIELVMLTLALSVGYHLVTTEALTVGAVTGSGAADHPDARTVEHADAGARRGAVRLRLTRPGRRRRLRPTSTGARQRSRCAPGTRRAAGRELQLRRRPGPSGTST